MPKYCPDTVPAGTKYTEEYMSNRREVTQMEKQNALQRAKQQQTENSFIVVMRPTCVYRRFYLVIFPINSIDLYTKTATS